ncbi:MAG: multidrug efflux SMR transporter [Halieaceae bacterium]|jgi:quaternary ammonium compound-resistance protein SugE|nr:multidrug efflux SMR transporter [Halieaceae bacterium]
MAWTVLFLAGCFEVAWAVALRYSQGFTRLWPSIIFGVTAWLSFMLLSQALKSIPMGTAYAVWTGIGAVGVAIFGIFAFSESASLPRVLCIALIVIGILGLRFTEGGSAP